MNKNYDDNEIRILVLMFAVQVKVQEVQLGRLILVTTW